MAASKFYLIRKVKTLTILVSGLLELRSPSKKLNTKSHKKFYFKERKKEKKKEGKSKDSDCDFNPNQTNSKTLEFRQIKP